MRLAGGQHREMRERPDGDADDRQVGPRVGESSGLADGELVRPHEAFRAHDRVPLLAESAGDPVLDPEREARDSVVHGSTPVRDSHKADRGHQDARVSVRSRPHDARTRSSSGRTTRRASARRPSMRSRASAIAVAAIAPTGCASVVSGGSISSAQAGSSTATSARSSGTRTRARRIARSAPRLMRLLATTSAVGRGVVPSSVSTAVLGCVRAEAAADGERDQARGAHGGRVPLEPLRSGLDVEAAADEGDPGVTEPQQMLGGTPHALDVVAHDGVDAGILDCPIEGDDGSIEREQRVDTRAGRIRRGHDRRDHAFVGEHLEVCALLLRRLVRVAEQHSIAGRVGRVLDDPHGLAEMRVLDVRDDHADHLGLLSPQVARETIGAVVHPRHRIEHAPAVFLPDRLRAVEHPRHGGRGDLRELRDLAHARGARPRTHVPETVFFMSPAYRRRQPPLSSRTTRHAVLTKRVRWSRNGSPGKRLLLAPESIVPWSRTGRGRRTCADGFPG